jgi:hypothetical protein
MEYTSAIALRFWSSFLLFAVVCLTIGLFVY